MTFVSLTYRPLIDRFLEISLEKFVSIVVDKNVDEYFIAAEKGSNSEINTHYQCYLKINCRLDNYNKKMRMLLEADKISYVGKSIKESDRYYHLGYCMKEDPQVHETNIAIDVLHDARKIYKDRNIKQRSSPKEFLTINKIVESVILLHEEEKLTSYSSQIYRQFVHENRLSIGFQSFSRINQMTLEDFVNIALGREHNHVKER